MLSGNHKALQSSRLLDSDLEWRDQSLRSGRSMGKCQKTRSMKNPAMRGL